MATFLIQIEIFNYSKYTLHNSEQNNKMNMTKKENLMAKNL